MKKQVKLVVTTALTSAMMLSTANIAFAEDVAKEVFSMPSISEGVDRGANLSEEPDSVVRKTVPNAPAAELGTPEAAAPATPTATTSKPEAAAPATPTATPSKPEAAAPATPAATPSKPEAATPATPAAPAAPATTAAPAPRSAAPTEKEITDIVFYSDDISGLRDRSKVFVEKKLISQETATKMNEYLTKLEQEKTTEVANVSQMQAPELKGYIDQKRSMTVEQHGKNIFKDLVNQSILSETEADSIKNELLESTKASIASKYKTELDQLVATNVLTQDKAYAMLNYVITNHPAVKGFEEQQNVGEIHFQQKVDGGALYYEQKPTGDRVYFEQTPGQGAVYYEQSALEATKELDSSELFSGMSEAGILTEEEVSSIQQQINK